MATTRKKAAAPKGGIDVEKLCQEIALGRHDDKIHDISQAAGMRLIEKSMQMRWSLEVSLPDHGTVLVDEDRITIDEMETAERLSGVVWHSLHPLKRGSIRVPRAIVAAHLIHGKGVEEDDAIAAVGSLTAVAIVKGYSEYVADADPFPGADPSS